MHPASVRTTPAGGPSQPSSIFTHSKASRRQYQRTAPRCGCSRPPCGSQAPPRHIFGLVVQLTHRRRHDLGKASISAWDPHPRAPDFADLIGKTHCAQSVPGEGINLSRSRFTVQKAWQVLQSGPNLIEYFGIFDEVVLMRRPVDCFAARVAENHRAPQISTFVIDWVSSEAVPRLVAGHSDERVPGGQV